MDALEKKHLIYYYSLVVLFVLPVFIDLINGFLILQVGADFSAGVLFRGAVYMACLPFVFLCGNRVLQWFLFTVFLLWGGFNIGWYFLSDHYSPVNETMQLFRMTYQYLVLAYLIYLTTKFRLNIQRIFYLCSWFGFIAGCALIFSFITGIGVTTYGDYGYGMASFFKAQNDIGLAILITLPMSFYLLATRPNVFRLLVVLTCIASLFILSTRAGVMGSVGCVVVYALAIFFYPRSQVRIPQFFKLSLGLVMLVGLGIGLYTYIEIIKTDEYLVDKYFELVEGSARENLVAIAEVRLDKRPVVYDVIGEGDLAFHRYIEFFRYGSRGSLPNGREVEHDFYDLVGSYGYLLGGLLLLFPVICLGISLVRFVFRPSLLNVTICCALGLYCIHSLTAGHAITSPTVAVTSVCVFLYVFRYRSFQTSPTAAPLNENG